MVFRCTSWVVVQLNTEQCCMRNRPSRQGLESKKSPTGEFIQLADKGNAVCLHGW